MQTHIDLGHHRRKWRGQFRQLWGLLPNSGLEKKKDFYDANSKYKFLYGLCTTRKERTYTRCDNLIPGMDLWKQNLLTCALAISVAFEILSLWSYALRETMVPLPETILKIVFRNTSRCIRYQECQQIFVPSGHFLILERAKNRRGPSQVNKVDGPFL
jgi:hypothetical protein